MMPVRCAVTAGALGGVLALPSCSFLEPSIGALTDDAALDGSSSRIDAAVDGVAGVDASADTSADGASSLRPVSFRIDIRPLMNRSERDPSGHGCKACHYSTQPIHPGLDVTGLDLATLGTLRLGGNDTGPAIVIPGDPLNSKLPQKLLGTFPLGSRMPRDGPPFWSPVEVALVQRWIAEGAIGADDE
jgi:hypothetical protein